MGGQEGVSHFFPPNPLAFYKLFVSLPLHCHDALAKAVVQLLRVKQYSINVVGNIWEPRKFKDISNYQMTRLMPMR